MNVKICAITTRDMTMKSFMVDTLNYFADNGFDVVIICEPSDNVRNAISEKVKYYPIIMKSGVESPLKMCSIVCRMVKIFKKERINMVQYASTNAGLYAAVASKICRVPNRIFCQWGMMYVGSTGFRRWLFKTIERTICMLSTSVQSDSKSNADFAIKERIVKKDKCEVIWNGSSTGVDISKFLVKDKESSEIKMKKTELGLQQDSFVFGFIGRMNSEKGLNELLSAYIRLSRELQRNVELVLVGPKESEVSLNEKLEEMLKRNLTIHYYGMSNEVQKYYEVLDVFVLPSYREGIATVLLEACACGLPIVSTRINGSIDVVYDDYNGFLCEPHNEESLYTAMKRAISINKEKYMELSHNARNVAVNMFDHNRLANMLLEDRLKKHSSINKGD